MSNRTEKPMRSPAELVAMLRDEKGITFHHMSESEAEQYLTDRNNYLRTASYRKNYDKHRTGGTAGKYIRLDFAYLVELSKLDMYLRARLLPMCIDLEHALKVRILADIEENTAENGYDIAASFLSSNPDIMKTIAQKADSIFTGDLIDKYFSLCYVFDAGGNIRTEIQDTDCPVWVLVELLAFKDFTRFLRYYCSRYPGRISINFNHLNTIRSLRNACAHNNCLLLSLRPGATQPTAKVSQYVARIPGTQKEERKNKLSCRPIFEIVCLLMEYDSFVSEQLRKHRMDELKTFAHGRLVGHMDFFAENQIISTAVYFLQKVIDSFG